MARAAGPNNDGRRRAMRAVVRRRPSPVGPAPRLPERARSAAAHDVRRSADRAFAEQHNISLRPTSDEAPPRVVLERYAARLWTWFAGAGPRPGALDRRGRGAGSSRNSALASLDRAAESLTRFLADESARGRLDVRHPPAAAELFLTLVAGRVALARAELTAHGAADDEARACARLFLRAHAPRRGAAATVASRPAGDRPRPPILHPAQERAT